VFAIVIVLKASDKFEVLAENDFGEVVRATPALADGKLYLVSQSKGTYVVAAKPKYELLAHNVIADDLGDRHRFSRDQRLVD